MYFFSPESTVFSPVPPPITTMFGPWLYTVLLNISDFTFTFFLLSILSSVDSTNTSNVLLLSPTNPIIIDKNPTIKTAIIFPTSLNDISFNTSISAIP